MAGAFNDPAEAKVGAIHGDIFIEVVVGNESPHDILAAGDETTRLRHGPRMVSIRLLARASLLYDSTTGEHIGRINEYSYFLAEKLGLPRAQCEEIRYSAQLHDVGKLSIDAAILRKNGKLTRAERREMMNHPIYGHEILRQSPRLVMAAEIALYHHEKWDGTGYPKGAAGEDIPVHARVVALADVYDALRSKRPYKPAYSHAETIAILLDGDHRIDPSGHFDPALLELLRQHHDGPDAIHRSPAH